jgi:D-mannonate dehydratase
MVHVASLRQDGARLLEAFLDEGTVDVTGAVKACRDAGYRGVLRPASGPCMMEDTAWGHRAMAFSAGYLRAVLQTVERA